MQNSSLDQNFLVENHLPKRRFEKRSEKPNTGTSIKSNLVNFRRTAQGKESIAVGDILGKSTRKLKKTPRGVSAHHNRVEASTSSFKRIT